MNKIILGGILLILIWTTWAYTGKDYKGIEPKGFVEIIEDINPSDSLKKNVVGIQPYMLSSDYLSEEIFYKKIRIYFEKSRLSGFLKEKTVILLPEHLGTWLAIANEKASLAKPGTLNSGMTKLVLSNPVNFIKHLMSGKGEKDWLAAALFRMKSSESARIYENTFKRLAEEYNVHIIAGSILLPKTKIVKNHIEVEKSKKLFNQTFVFSPKGKIFSKTVKKVYPISSEKDFTEQATINTLPSFELPIGKTSIAICADSWYPDIYDEFNKQKTEVILVPSFCTGTDAMSTPWGGYDGWSLPSDVEKSDIGKITEAEAWDKYALNGRIHFTGANVGINVFLKGKLWDLGADGNPTFIINKKKLSITSSEKAGIWNVNF